MEITINDVEIIENRIENHIKMTIDHKSWYTNSKNTGMIEFCENEEKIQKKQLEIVRFFKKQNFNK